MARILIIDDNEPLLEMQSSLLGRAGHDVTSTVSGVEAMRLAYDQPFDLVITDLYMPEKEGIEIIMELRRQAPEIKIIAMSGGGRTGPGDLLATARVLGAVKTLAKPFSGKELVDAVQSVLQEVA